MFKGVQIHKIKNASKAEKKAFRAAGIQLGIELSDPEFWQEVSEEYYLWTNPKKLGDLRLAPLNWTQSFEEFKEMVLSGSDNFNTEADGDLDISVTYYYSFLRVVGYTKASTWKTWANRNILKGFDLGDIGGHQFHEYLHNCGLGHPGTDKKSVIYMIGYLVRKRVKARLGLESSINIKYKRSFWTRVKRFFGGMF